MGTGWSRGLENLNRNQKNGLLLLLRLLRLAVKRGRSVTALLCKKIYQTSKGTSEGTNSDSEAQEMVKPSRDMFILGT